MKIREILSKGESVLVAAGVATPAVDAELLLAHALGITRSEVMQCVIFNDFISDDVAASYQELINQRATRKPLQHITGKAPFRYLELNVGSGVFIPRPETELVAGAAIDWLKNQASTNREKHPLIAVDLCTGSGAIAIAIATECPNSKVYAVELNETAYQWAAKNIEELSPQVTLINTDARSVLPKLTELTGKADLVVSNPPYLAPNEIPPAAEVQAHDPAMALYGQGGDGLEIPGCIVQSAARLLKPGGFFVVEHGDNQAAALIEIAQAAGFADVLSHQDFTGRDRFITANWPGLAATRWQRRTIAAI